MECRLGIRCILIQLHSCEGEVQDEFPATSIEENTKSQKVLRKPYFSFAGPCFPSDNKSSWRNYLENTKKFPGFKSKI